MAQADAPFRNDPSDLDHLYTANANGEMVPLNTMVTLQQSYGPDPVIRYNGYPAADLIGQSDPTVLSSAQALAMVAQTRSEEHTSELQSRGDLVCRLLLEKKKITLN